MKKPIILIIILVVIVALVILEYKESIPNEIKDKISEEDGLLVVYECYYQSQKVYYFQHGCCDFIDQTYSEGGDLICSQGGIAGIDDCEYERKDCRIIWKDD